MALPPLLSTGLLKLLPIGPSLLPRLPDVGGFLRELDSLLGGPEEPAPEADDTLVAQLAMSDPQIRQTLLREIERRLSDDVPETPELKARLERLREMLLRLNAEPALPPAEAPAAEVVATSPTPALVVPPPPLLASAEATGRREEPGRGVAALAASSNASSAPAAPVTDVAGLGNPELVDRVLRAARQAQSRNLSRLRLTLEPAELGPLDVELTLRERVLHGVFHAEAPAAAEALAARLHELKEALERRGLKVGALSVHVGAPTDGGAAFAYPDPAPPRAAAGLDLKA